MCAEGQRPICQDTGIVNVFLKIGMDVRFEGFAGQRRGRRQRRRAPGYLDADNPLRASIVARPALRAQEHPDNTPAVVHMTLVPGNTVEVTVAAKGGGSENKSKFAMLNPSDSLVDWVLKTVPTMGAGWCPPGMLGIGIGGTAEKAMLLAKEALMDDIDMHELKARGPQNKTEELRIELFDKVNALGIGAQGLGGLTTVLDVKIAMAPTHAAIQAGGDDPELRRDAPRPFRARRLRPGVPRAAEPRPLARRALGARLQPVDAGRSRHADARRRSRAGSRASALLLNGKMLTGRDAAHKRIQDMLAQGRAAAGRFHRTASSTTSARSIRCATRWSARPARRRRRAWTSSPR